MESSKLCRSSAKDRAGPLDRRSQTLDFLERVVEVKAGPATGDNLQPIMKWHGTMMAGTNGHALAVERLGQVMGVNSLDQETNHPGGLITPWAKQAKALDF